MRPESIRFCPETVTKEWDDASHLDGSTSWPKAGAVRDLQPLLGLQRPLPLGGAALASSLGSAASHGTLPGLTDRSCRSSQLGGNSGARQGETPRRRRQSMAMALRQCCALLQGAGRQREGIPSLRTQLGLDPLAALEHQPVAPNWRRDSEVYPSAQIAVSNALRLWNVPPSPSRRDGARDQLALHSTRARPCRMSYPHRYIPPIYVDLNMPATPSKDKEAPAQQQLGSPSSNFTAMLQSRGGCSAEPRPSRANSLFLDLLEFPLAAADANPDVLLKCELDGVLDVGNGHDTPAGAQQQVFPLPNGQDDDTPDQDVAKMKQSRDPEVLEEVAAFPAAVFTSTTISASRPASTAAPSLVAQRGGRTSQFSVKQRRERHNANERRRTNAAKDRVRDMRDVVAALERRRAELSAQRDAKAAAKEVLPHRRPLEDVVPRECVDSSIPGSSTYLDLAKSVDELRNEKRYLEEQMDQLDSQNSALQAVQAELVIDAAASLTAAGAKKSLKRKRVEADGVDDAASDSKRMALEVDVPAGGYCMETEAVPSYLKVLFSEPMTSDAAFNWVKDSYGDIMALKAQQKPADAAPTSVLGWREDKREVAKSEGPDAESSLELMMTQDFPGIVSGELVFNTWNILTMLEAFQKLFPLTKDLAVLQTINDDCVIVRVGIAPARDAPVVHSIMVLARGQIDGGYLLSMRSVPLSAGQKAFAAGEESYLPVLAWFMLLDKYDEYAQPVCEVVVGASTQHKSERVLQRLATEFVAGVVRWQEAVGQSKHWLL
ncbi:hypothetical protein PHYPSEUDO_007974 [Phytophthora pseudosyringae]|uniref:Uncharacterized protein n=1 Tax=Phytophthora pseudosyringae TaxID=221518 RepID=A0A8T1WB25_9STRA|nr:hypothetical protein PHYPSEUDO_007974 [Phytophthora pseudosyringae]